MYSGSALGRFTLAFAPPFLEIFADIGDCSRFVPVDSFVIAYFKNRQELNDFIKSLLSKKNVDRSVTHIVLNVVKEERRIMV